MKNYLLAASLGNGNIRLFADTAKDLKWTSIAGHFLLIAAGLYLPLLRAIVPLSPYEVFARINPEYLGELDPDTFNIGMHEGGYSVHVLVPLLAGMFAVLLLIQAVFFICTALLSGMSRDDFSFRERLGIYVMSATMPLIVSAAIGYFLPTVHIVVFYLAEIVLGFYIVKKYDEAGKQENELWEYPV